jgi:ribonuclease E
MRLESLSSRMDFDERRARALETVVQYRAGTGPSREPQQARPKPPQDDRPPQQQTRPAPPPPPASEAEPAHAQQTSAISDEPAGESNTARRRRRRRRGRRGGRGRTPEAIGPDGMTAVASPEDSATPPHGDPTADAAMDEEPEADFDDGATDAEPARDDSGEEPDPSAQ